MYYNLNNKKQRKKFWKECAESLKNVKELNHNIFSWHDVGESLDALKVLKFWESAIIYWTKFNIPIPKNVQGTLDYYEEYGDGILDGYQLF